MKQLIKNEFKGWKFSEVFWLILATLIIFGLSIYWGDTPMGIISASTGVICVITTGKGKLSCYLFGIINIILYAIISYNAKYYGETILNIFYYLPMQFIGFAMWKKHMNDTTKEVYKKRLSLKNIGILSIIALSTITIYGFILKTIGGNLPYIDSTATTLSVISMILCVRRYMEQWILWIIINILSVTMWFINFLNGNNDIATLIMWIVYLINAIIMFVKWYKESKSNNSNRKIYILDELSPGEYEQILKKFNI